ncbi:DUF6443 domain-containing protein [uncultured Bacteroides sp.]|uniref:DUF6443 domain-containing protein n=1 Tax=uncultured Bacteroides sp. TaxID=162156 RepID=UPI002613CCC4|nr:DUF6443 domain-containing protein [uncultured Bacteroides sp.]
MKRIYILIVLCILSGWVKGQVSGNQNYISTQTYITSDKQKSLEQIVYYDGLGRPVETVDKGVTPDSKDLVSLQEYDQFGRESYSWLPAKSNGNGVYVDIASVKSGAQQLSGGDTRPYTMLVYEASPLKRMTKQYSPGQAWQDKPVQTVLKTNILGSAQDYTGPLSCISFTPFDGEYLYKGGYVEAGNYFVTQTIDEDGNEVYEFRDLLDRVTLTRSMDGATHYSTYYVYDGANNLRYVLPPLAADAFEGSLWGRYDTDSIMSQYAYIYRYDGFNRCIYKKLPGCEPVYYIYDKAGRLILSQDGEQRSKGEWMFTLPDILGRTVLSGICKNSFDYKSKPLEATVVKATWGSSVSTNMGYTISGLTLSDPVILSADYYDNYDFIGKNSIPSSMGYDSSVSGFGIRYTDGYKGLLTGKVTAQLTGAGISGYLYSAFYYDDRGRIIQSRSTNHLGGLETECFAYNLIGDVLKKKHVHTKGAISQEELYTYDYDHARRLIKTRHKLGNNAEVVLSENTYNDLGQLATSRKHGRSDLTTTYTYNVRSWLKSVSTGNLFSQTLYYNESYGGSTGRYNGNISAMSWKSSGDSGLRGYAFSYDGLSRLTAANYLLNGSVNANYNTSYTYDKHGNLKTLMRYGKTGSSVYGVMDNLTCTYTGNQLYNVSDSGTDPLYSGAFNFMDGTKNSSREYKYDANGNMQEDFNNKITKIQYNFLNLPVALQFTNGNRTDYLYGSDGMKRRVIYSTAVANVNVPMGEIRTLSSNQVSATHTVDYCGNVIYEGGNLSKILTEEGYITLSGSAPTYHYYLKDHQGNNRVVTYWNGSKWLVEQVNHYYPFGGVFAEGTAVSNQAYKYNGKELDRMHGLDWYDYSARHYDAALGIFTTMDPMAEKYYSTSPYGYCANNPFKHVDPDGRSWYSYNQDGKIIYEWNINIRSQEDLDKIRENATYIGNIHSDGNTYYSLFGNKYSIDSKEGKTMQKIDEALINYSQASPKYDYYGNLISGGEDITNFDIGEYPQNSSLNLSEDTYFTFQAEGGLVTYFKVSEGIDNKAKFGGFGYVTKGQVRGQGNRGVGNLKDGIPIYFERQNTPGNIVQRSAQIVFPTQKVAESFYQKYSLILKRK